MLFNIVFFLSVLCYTKCIDLELLQPPLDEGSTCTVNGRNGTCVNIYKCTSAAVIHEYYETSQWTALEDNAKSLPMACSYNQDGEPIVCCTDCELDQTERYRTITILNNGYDYKKPQSSTAFKKCLEYMRELPFSCRGQSDDTVRLIYEDQLQCTNISHFRSVYAGIAYGYGGYFAAKLQLPHMALLGYGADRESAQWLCGGAVISEYFILTAAHCSSTDRGEPISFAALGALNRSEVSDFWKVYDIKDIIVHPDYASPHKYHDIALLRTQNEINFAPGLLPACLDVGIVSTQKGSAPGWGRLGSKGRLAERLMVMDLNQFNDTECASIYPTHRHLRHGYDTKTQMCYGRRDKVVDTCMGDSGGPIHTHISCMYIMFGVTSFGKDCATLGNAGIYTRVRSYVPWIESIVWPNA